MEGGRGTSFIGKWDLYYDLPHTKKNGICQIIKIYDFHYTDQKEK
jgi:hypothetical protein